MAESSLIEFEGAKVLYDLDAEVYHKTKAISKSGLDYIARSPLHYWDKYLNDEQQLDPQDREDIKRTDPEEAAEEEEEQDPKALHFGRAFHTAILEPEKFEQDVAVYPKKWPTKAECGITQDDQKIAWRKANAKRALITEKDRLSINSMAGAVLNHPRYEMVFGHQGYAEASFFWRDKETGVICRGRLDWFSQAEGGIIVDVKSAKTAHPNEFDKHAYNYRYHVQCAMYSDAYEAVFGKPPQLFIFIAVEKKRPFALSWWYADTDFMTKGRQVYRAELNIYAKCLAENVWPGYPETIERLSLPGWVLRDNYK